MQKKLQKEKAIAIILAIIEALVLFSSFIYVIMNIYEPDQSPLKKRTAGENEFLIWLSCLTSTLTFVSILLVIGAIRNNFWLMIPSVGLHMTGIIFFLSVVIAGIARSSQYPAVALAISEVVGILIAWTCLVLGGIGIFFARLIMDQAEGVKTIVLTKA